MSGETSLRPREQIADKRYHPAIKQQHNDSIKGEQAVQHKAGSH
jgi:hypothetical protein